MSEELEKLKKKILYRASYRGTKEMDILLSSFTKNYINILNVNQLNQLEVFLKFEDEIILNYYNFDIKEKNIENNEISKLFKNHKI